MTQIAVAIQRLEEQRDASRASARDPSNTVHQQDMAAARGWAFERAIEILHDEER